MTKGKNVLFGKKYVYLWFFILLILFLGLFSLLISSETVKETSLFFYSRFFQSANSNSAQKEGIRVDFSKPLFSSKLYHGANEADGLLLEDVSSSVHLARNGFGLDTFRYWLQKPWWKVGAESTTLPNNFVNDPDLKNIDAMLKEAKSTGAELQFVLAHAPDFLLPEGEDTYSKEKNKLGIHSEKYDQFKQYALDMVQYIAYDSPEALGRADFVFEIWNEPAEDTFSSISKDYVDVVNEIGLLLLEKYPDLTISANPWPYFSGYPGNSDTEMFLVKLDNRVAQHFRMSIHLYNNLYTQNSLDAYFSNSNRLFFEGPKNLRAFMQTLGSPKAEIPIYVSEHNLHTELSYKIEMAGKEGAAVLACNIINMIRSNTISGHHFYLFTSRSESLGYGLIGKSGEKFSNFAVFSAIVKYVPRGSIVYESTSASDIKSLAVQRTGESGIKSVLLVNSKSSTVKNVHLFLTDNTPIMKTEFLNVLSEKNEEITSLAFEPFEVKLLLIE